MRKSISRFVPTMLVDAGRRVLERLDSHATLAYSQEGEDLILRRLFEGGGTGFFVDVGAHHPSRFSNTLYFYRRGWRGINIDPNPDAIALFRQARPDDINLCVGVAEAPGMLQFYMFDEPALSTFDRDLAAERERTTPYRLLGSRDVEVRRLADIIAAAAPDRPIDFMTVDTENFDLQVLKSNDWDRFRPRYLLVEAREVDLSKIDADPVHGFALSQRYRLIAKTVNTSIYEDAR